MTRTFTYNFDPPSQCPIQAATADLTVAEIEDAGLKEVLQTPGSVSSWAVLDALLHPATASSSPFLFREPLGRAREVKVALSGLFGRFVARAYLQRYFQLTFFTHLGSGTVTLAKRHNVRIARQQSPHRRPS